jgi:hypothetical protein
MAKKPQPYTKTEKCKVCVKHKGKILTGEGNPVPCPYCKGTRKVTRKAVHPSHKMSTWKSEILAPMGTPRFYSTRYCRKCGYSEAQHAAGHFLNALSYPCSGRKDD